MVQPMGWPINTGTLLLLAVVLLGLIWWELSKISSRLKDRFPTEREQDYKWAQDDPMGHWEAHKREHDGKDETK
jgi:hypothetical protein